MNLFGHEIQALLGAMMIVGGVPFVFVPAPELSPEDEELIESITVKLRTARSRIIPPISRAATGWLDQLHQSETIVELSSGELELLTRITNVCLLELQTDGDLSAHVGGIGLSSLRSVNEKLKLTSSVHR